LGPSGIEDEKSGRCSHAILGNWKRLENVPEEYEQRKNEVLESPAQK